MSSSELVGCGRAGPEKESSAATWATKQARDTDMLAWGCAQTELSRSTQVSHNFLKKTQKHILPIETKIKKNEEQKAKNISENNEKKTK